MSVILKDERGRNLTFARQSDWTTVELVPGPWRALSRPFTVPPQIGPAKVTGVQLAIVIEGLRPEQRIFYDDIGVCRLGD